MTVIHPTPQTSAGSPAAQLILGKFSTGDDAVPFTPELRSADQPPEGTVQRGETRYWEEQPCSAISWIRLEYFGIVSPIDSPEGH